MAPHPYTPFPTEFEFFISYRSTWILRSRQFAEQCIASGRCVWFDEYTILLSQHDDVGDLIRSGISQSRCGVCLICSDYFTKKWTSWEHALLQENEKQILEIPLEADTEHSTETGTAPTISRSRYAPHTNDALRFLKTQLKLPVSSSLPQWSVWRNKSRAFEFDDLQYRIGVRGWKMTSPGIRSISGLRRLDGLNFEGPQFERSVRGRHLGVNVTIGEEKETRVRPSLVETSDREWLGVMKQFAVKYFKNDDYKCVGVHLMPHDGLGQFAVSYWYEKAQRWMRKYSVVLYLDHGPPLELVFTFGLDGSFLDFCRYAFLMDQFVQSLEVEMSK